MRRNLGRSKTADDNGRRGSLKGQIELLFSGRMLEKLVSFAALVVMTRLMTPADLALLPTFYIAGSAAVILAGLGGMPIIMIELPRLATSDAVRAATLMRTILGCYLLACGVVLAILTRYPNLLEGFQRIAVSRPEAMTLLAGAVVHGAYSLVSQALAALGRFKPLIVVEVFLAVLRLVAVIPAYLFGGRIGLLLALGASSVIGLVLALWLIRDLLLRAGPRWDHRSYLQLSWPLYLEGYLMFFRRQGDQIVVAAMLGATSLAGYYLARRLVNLLKTLADSFDSAVAPAMSRLSLSSSQHFSSEWNRYFALSLAAATPIAVGTALIAPAHMAIVGGREYEAFTAAASILCLSFVVDVVKGSVISRAVFVLFPTWMRLFLTTIETVLLLPLLAVGAWLADATGAAIGVVVAGVVAGLCGLVVLGRRVTLQVSDGASIAAIWQSLAAAAIALAVSATLQRLQLVPYEMKQAVVALASAVTFGVAYANLLSPRGLHLLKSSLKGTRVAPIVRVIEFVRFRRDGGGGHD